MTPDLVKAACPWCRTPQLYRRDRVGALVPCREDGAQFKLGRADPFGRKQWGPCRDVRVLHDALRLLRARPSARKRRLVAVAVGRACFGWCRNPWFREALAAGEELAATGTSARDVAEVYRHLDPPALWRDDREPWRVAGRRCVEPDPEFAYPGLEVTHPGAVVGILHEVLPNPFRAPVVRPEWRTGAVAGLAAGADAAGAFDRLPVLADALEEAGCTEVELLAHLRGPGPHLRGCWALDAVLGRE